MNFDSQHVKHLFEAAYGELKRVDFEEVKTVCEDPEIDLYLQKYSDPKGNWRYRLEWHDTKSNKIVRFEPPMDKNPIKTYEIAMAAYRKAPFVKTLADIFKK